MTSYKIIIIIFLMSHKIQYFVKTKFILSHAAIFQRLRALVDQLSIVRSVRGVSSTIGRDDCRLLVEDEQYFFIRDEAGRDFGGRDSTDAVINEKLVIPERLSTLANFFSVLKSSPWISQGLSYLQKTLDEAHSGVCKNELESAMRDTQEYFKICLALSIEYAELVCRTVNERKEGIAIISSTLGYA